MAKPTAITVYTLALVAAASGNSLALGCGNLDALAVDITLSALTGGATAVQFFVDRLGVDGVWYQVWASASLTGAGAASTSIGPGLATAQAIGQQCRLRWATTGGGGVTATGSIIGR